MAGIITGSAPWAKRSEPDAEPFEVEPYEGIRKRIYTDSDLNLFLASESFAGIWTFILDLNESVKNKRVSEVLDTVPKYAALNALSTMLTLLLGWVEQIPPETGPRRFGNPAFRTWHAKLRECSADLIESLLDECIVSGVNNSAVAPKGSSEREVQVKDLCAYLEQSFGNRTRIDYGSGHEASFIVFLFCLSKLDLFVETERNASNDQSLSNDIMSALVLGVFPKYLDVARALQKDYMLEPAGSHGVWGLDDYSFLPFLWGSSQLYDSSTIDPKVIHNNEQLKALSDEYIYLKAIQFIKEVKTGVFHEHSPMLTDISSVPGGWQKINSGMIKMYKAEVWSKRVVVQHIVFGTLFPFPEPLDKQQ